MTHKDEIVKDVEKLTNSCNRKQKEINILYENKEKDLTAQYVENYKHIKSEHDKLISSLRKRIKVSADKNCRKMKQDMKRLSLSSSELTSLPCNNNLYDTKQNKIHGRKSNASNSRYSLFIENPNNSNYPMIADKKGRKSYVQMLKNENRKSMNSLKSFASDHENKALSKLDKKIVSINGADVNQYKDLVTNSVKQISEAELQFLLKRQEIRRVYLSDLSDLKQQRLDVLLNHTRSYIQRFYEIQRKWLMHQHHTEIKQRKMDNQAAMKAYMFESELERHQINKYVTAMNRNNKKLLKKLKVGENAIANGANHNILLEDWTRTNASIVHPWDSQLETVFTANDSDDDQSMDNSRRKSVNYEDNGRASLISPFENRQSSIYHNGFSPNYSHAENFMHQFMERQNNKLHSVYTREQEISETMLNTYFDQVRQINKAESAALTRAQHEFDNRKNYLQNVDETYRCYVESEFDKEREHLLSYYCNADLNVSSYEPRKSLYFDQNISRNSIYQSAPKLYPMNIDGRRSVSSTADKVQMRKKSSITLPSDFLENQQDLNGFQFAGRKESVNQSKENKFYTPSATPTNRDRRSSGIRVTSIVRN